jgi:hypothetical protein
LNMRQKKTKPALKFMQILLQIFSIPRNLSPRLILPPSGRAEMLRQRLQATRPQPVLALHLAGGPRRCRLRVVATRPRPALVCHLEARLRRPPRLRRPLSPRSLLLILSSLDRLRPVIMRAILWCLQNMNTSKISLHHLLPLLFHLCVFVLDCSKV